MNTMYRANVEPSFSTNGVAIRLGRQTERGLLVLGPIMSLDWNLIPEGVSTNPALHLEDGLARALMQALVKHYDFSLNTSTARMDYLYERGRVDTLTATILDILRQRNGV